MAKGYTIGTLARRAGVSVEAIRYYQRRGLIEEPARPLGGTRRYADDHARRLRFIKQAQAIGFSLEEVRDLLGLDDGENCHRAAALGAKKLDLVRNRIAQLRNVELALATLIEQCRCNTGTARCPLIAALEGESP